MKIIRFDSINFEPASHEDFKAPGVLKKMLLRRDDLAPGRVQMINWAKLGVGKTFRPHSHQDMQEIFIIIKGTAMIRIDKENETMHTGDYVVIPPKEIHEMTNIGKDEVEYIVIGIV